MTHVDLSVHSNSKSSRNRLGRMGTALIATAISGIALFSSTEAKADDPPPFIPWSSLLPGLTTEYVPSSSNICVSGAFSCVDSVIQEMETREAPLDASCSHNEVFALTYLRTTQQYLTSATQPGFFSDPNFINHQDALFANFYFTAWDNWRNGHQSDVPEAWQIAFDAADHKQVSGLGNLLLGMSAHVNRDLPYVLAEIGLVKPDGSSRKPDHDKVNQFLNLVIEPLVEEVAARFDPSVGYTEFQGTTLDDAALLQILVAWRELAWRNAELLVSAPTPAAKQIVMDEIERVAAVEANLIKVATAYGPINLNPILAELAALAADPLDVLAAQADNVINVANQTVHGLFTPAVTQRDNYCATHG